MLHVISQADRLVYQLTPAIKGGCVTRREQRQDPETSARK